MAIPDDSDKSTSIAFRDVLFLTLSCFVIIIILLLPHIAVDLDQRKVDDPPGHIIVEISWKPNTWTDIDLWVLSPNDVRPVGYSNQDGRGFNLLRDDLGNRLDPLPENYENSYMRGIPDGEYIVNVHGFSDTAKALPLEVHCSVRIKNKKFTTVIAKKTVLVTHVGQEITVFRFNLKNAALDGEVHEVPYGLRLRNVNLGMGSTSPSTLNFGGQ